MSISIDVVVSVAAGILAAGASEWVKSAITWWRKGRPAKLLIEHASGRKEQVIFENPFTMSEIEARLSSYLELESAVRSSIEKELADRKLAVTIEEGKTTDLLVLSENRIVAVETKMDVTNIEPDIWDKAVANQRKLDKLFVIVGSDIPDRLPGWLTSLTSSGRLVLNSAKDISAVARAIQKTL